MGDPRPVLTSLTLKGYIMNFLNSGVGLVHAKDYNGHEALFVMRKDDPRYASKNYRRVTNGMRVDNVFVGANGVVYDVFSDWSAKPSTTQKAAIFAHDGTQVAGDIPPPIAELQNAKWADHHGIFAVGNTLH